MTDSSSADETESRRPFEGFENSLYAAASEEARNALGNYAADNREALRSAAISAGAAAEYLLSTTIVFIDPVLLAKPRHFQSLVALSRHNGAAALDPLTLRTADWNDLLSILQNVHANLTLRSEMDSLMSVRNAAIHAALVTPATLEKAVVTLAKVVGALHSVLPHRNEATFWGVHFADTVKELRDTESTASRQRLQSRIDHAVSELSVIVAGLDEQSKERTLAVLEMRPTLLAQKYDTREHECPACHRKGVIGYVRDRLDDPPTFEVDIDREGNPEAEWAVFLVQGLPLGFECPVCGLTLDAWDLDDFPEMGAVIELDPDVISSAQMWADYEPDEDYGRFR
jgi:hypothetical protein